MNTGLVALWMPIVLSAVIVFVMSSIIHMATPWHKNDYLTLPNEDAVANALRGLNIPPGDYMLPHAASMDEMKSEAFKEKMNKGPVFMATFMPAGTMNMGQTMGIWFVYSLVVSAIAAYVAHKALPWGTGYGGVFRIVGVVGFCCYGMALAQFSIWYKRNWMTTARSMVDSLIYGALMAGTFGWLWPK